MTPRPDLRLIHGIPVDNETMDSAIDRIMTMIEAYGHDLRPRLVATANVDFLVNAHNTQKADQAQELRHILQRADLVTADGMPLVWTSQIMGTPLKERVTGADMVPALAQRAAQESRSIYLLGGKDGSAKATARILTEAYPGLKIAGYGAPMIDLDDPRENAIEIARINVAQPDILLIALGNPKQEIWFNRYKQWLHVPVSIGIGGTFEFIAGMTARAPEWMQRHGLEWIFRMTQDPKRLIQRYLKGMLHYGRMSLPLLWRTLLSSSRVQPEGPLQIRLAPPLTLPQVLVDALPEDAISYFPTADLSSIEVDLSAIQNLGSHTALQLLQIYHWAKDQGVHLALNGLTTAHEKALRRLHLTDVLVPPTTTSNFDLALAA